MSELEKVVQDDSLSVKEKLNKLDKVYDKIKKEYYRLKESIPKGYTYCPHCKDYYKTKSFESFSKQVEEDVCIHSLCEFDEDEWVKASFIKYFLTCPKGHKFENPNISRIKL